MAKIGHPFRPLRRLLGSWPRLSHRVFPSSLPPLACPQPRPLRRLIRSRLAPTVLHLPTTLDRGRAPPSISQFHGKSGRQRRPSLPKTSSTLHVSSQPQPSTIHGWIRRPLLQHQSACRGCHSSSPPRPSMTASMDSRYPLPLAHLAGAPTQ